MGSQRSGGGDGNNDEGGAASTPHEPYAPLTRNVTSTTEGESRSSTPSSRSVTPLSPIQESSAEVAINSGASRAPDADLTSDGKYSTDASGVDSQWQSNAKPTTSARLLDHDRGM